MKEMQEISDGTVAVTREFLDQLARFLDANDFVVLAYRDFEGLKTPKGEWVKYLRFQG